MNILWIAWEDDGSIRSSVLSQELGAEYRAFISFTLSKLFGWLRYPVALVQTVFEICRRKPDLLIVQCPSILLAFEAAFFKPIFHFRLVIDLHTLYIKPTGLKRLIATTLNEYALNHCDALVVTNGRYGNRIARKTGRPVFVLPDKVPSFDGDFKRVPLQGRFNVLYICSFSSDEPWMEAIAAGKLLRDDTCIYISGRNRIAQALVSRNVFLTGYLPKEEYQNLLRSVDAVMVLTTADDCLVCGGYEAIAAGKPLILSDTPALRNFFNKGTVFAVNSSEAIAQAIKAVNDAGPGLSSEIALLKDEMAIAWKQHWDTLLESLDLPRNKA